MVLWLAGVVMAAVAQPPGGASPPVRLAAKLEPGQVLRYELGAALEVGAPGATGDRLEQRARLRMTVASVEEGGGAVLRGAFESLEATWRPAGGEETAFRWKEGEELPEEAPAAAKLYGALATSTLELTVGADGSLASVTGVEKAVAAGAGGAGGAGGEVGDPARLLGALAPGAIANNLAPVFALDTGAAPRRAGETWTTELKAGGVGSGTITTTVERTLKSVEAGVAVVEAKITQAWRARPGRPDLSEPTASPADQKGSAREKWDTRAGRLISRVMESSATWRLQLQTSPPMEAARMFKARVELSRVEGPPRPPEPRPPPDPGPAPDPQPRTPPPGAGP